MATLTHSPHALHAQTTTNPNHFHDSTSEIHSTNASSTQHSSTLSAALTPAAMDESEDETRERLIFAPALTVPRMDADSDMEGADDTAGRSPIWRPDGNTPIAPATSIDAPDVSSPVPEPLSPIPPPPPAELFMGGRPPPPPAELFSGGRPPPPPVLDGPTAANDSDDEDDDDDDDDDDRSHISDERARSFYPFKEDTSVPDDEEARIMRGYVEKSALDDQHWHSRTFFDLQDADMVPKEHGKIEWTIKEFNGTTENPRKNLLLTSHTVKVGGYDWRIKLLPHGNMHTDRLSLYVENVSIQSAESEEWPEDSLPLPVISEGVKVMRRTAVAAQVSILVYNPEEPRVNEFRADAHQFSQDSPDHGWTRFTSVPWYEIHRRSYAQRQPLLRNDTLAVKAFIRVIDDPTGCLWAAKESKKLSVTGLNPFHSGGYEDSALYPVLALWFHLRPFRELLYQLGSVHLNTKEDDNVLAVLQAMLWRMRSRVSSSAESTHVPCVSEFLEDFYEERGPQDAMQTMSDLFDNITTCLRNLEDKEMSQKALETLSSMFGQRQFSGDRQTKRPIAGKTSMQEVVDGDFPPDLESKVLTVELERQTFDPEKRVWKKLLNKVRLDDQITISGVTYTLYGFVAHEGHLRTGRYSSYFRPGGMGGLWYTYKHIFPTCQTRTQAVSSREGVLPAEAIEEPVVTADRPINYDRLLGHVDAVAYVVVYVRDSDAFDLAAKEPWDVPSWIPKTYVPAIAKEASNGASETLHYDDAASVASDEEMNDATEGSISDKVVEDAETLKQVTINYLSQPFYSGTINSSDQYHGKGHLIALSGDEYTGEFENSLRSGEGTMLYANSDTYVGAWLNDLPHGNGTHTSHRTGNVYTGNWEEGKKSGAGVTHWKMSEEESKACRICFGAEADAAFYDCGHVVACLSCARRVEDCPVCRRRIRDVVRLFYMA